VPRRASCRSPAPSVPRSPTANCFSSCPCPSPTISLESSSEAGAIDDETIAHVAALHARVGIVDLLDGDDFYVRDDFVFAAVVEHFLRLGNPADVAAGEAPVAKEEHLRIQRGRAGRQRDEDRGAKVPQE